MFQLCFFLLVVGGAGYYRGTGLYLHGSAKHLGFTGKPLQQDQQHLHGVTDGGGDSLHHLADQLQVRSLFLSRMSPSPTQVSEIFPSLSGWTMSHCTDIQSLVSSGSSSTPVFRTHLSSKTSGEPVTRAGDTGREEGGGDTGEEGADEEVAGKRNIGSLTTSEYTRTSLSTVTKLIQACSAVHQTQTSSVMSRAVVCSIP